MMRTSMLTTALCVVASVPGFAQNSNPDILQIAARFTASAVAAKRCAQPREEVIQKFQANHLTVLTFAHQKLKESGQVEADAERTIKSLSDGAAQFTNTLIDNDGCANPQVQQLVKLFDFHADWKPRRSR